MANKKQLTVKLVRSPIGRQPTHKATIAGLGLKRMHQSVQLEDTASVRGMINKVSYLLEVTE
ncbi:MAG TPA: 50S ribosomal protein L30 [Gammaproteobacteria bacterium]|nr:50S ribosomal protein L30 [Gammaproteobacteria bacterium]